MKTENELYLQCEGNCKRCTFNSCFTTAPIGEIEEAELLKILTPRQLRQFKEDLLASFSYGRRKLL